MRNSTFFRTISQLFTIDRGSAAGYIPTTMIKRSRIVLLVISVLVIGGIAYGATRPEKPAVAVTARVEKGVLVQTVEVTGTAQTVNDVDLAFDVSGTVDTVSVAVGETVVAGQTLASVNASDLSASASQASDSVVRAQAELAARLAGVSSEEISVATADVAVARAALSAAESDASQVGAVQDSAVASAEQGLAQARTDASRALSSSREDLAESARSAVAEIRRALSEADTVLGIENNLYNQTFEDVLGNEGMQTVTDANAAFALAARSRDAAEAAFLAMDASSDVSVVSAVLLVDRAYRDSADALLQTARVLDATVSDSVDLSVDDTKAFKATIATALASLIADGTALTNASQAFADAQAALTDDVAAAANALAAETALRNRAVASASTAVTSRSADLARAEAALASLVASPRDVDVAALRASVDAAQAELEGALARLQKTRIVAPIDGIVTVVEIDPGEFASAGQAAITVLSSGTEYEVAMDVPESDVPKMTVGDAAEITFDAFGDARTFQGSLVKIDPAQKLIEGVVYYAATVSLASGQDLSLVRPGMSSNVSVRTAELADAIFVPSRSVLVRDGAKYVRVQAADGTIEERSVRAGLYADGGKTQILSGLEEGETVIVSLSKS